MSDIECAFTGRVGREPQMRTTKDGKPWCSFSVAAGCDNDQTWISVATFDGVAEQAETLTKGTRVYVEGRLRLVTWLGQDGVERTGLQVTATLVQPIGQIGRRRAARTSRSSRQSRPSNGVDTKTASDWQRPLDAG